LIGVLEGVEILVDGPTPRNYGQILTWTGLSIPAVGVAALLFTASLGLLALVRRAGRVQAAIALGIVGSALALLVKTFGPW
jgi:hypothetical protein